MNTNIGRYYDICGVVTEHPEDIYLSEEGKIYEVIRIINEKPLFFQDHMRRMLDSIKLMNQDIRLDFLELNNRIRVLLKRNGYSDCNIKIVGPYRGDVILYINRFAYPTEEMYREGVKTSLFEIERHNPNAKVINESYKKAVADKLASGEDYEVLLVAGNHVITEGSRSNLFFIKGDKVFTAPDGLVLKGITRQYMFEAIRAAGCTVDEVPVDRDRLPEFDGLFLSGTSINALPVRSVGELVFDTPNLPAYKQIRREYENIMKIHVE